MIRTKMVKRMEKMATKRVKMKSMMTNRMLKRSRRKHQSQRRERDSCNIHSQSKTMSREPHPRSMPRSKRSKIECSTSKRKESRHMLSLPVFSTVLEKLSSTTTLRKLGSNNQRSCQSLVKVRTVCQPCTWRISLAWSNTSLRIHLRASSTSSVLITLRSQPRRNWFRLSLMESVLVLSSQSIFQSSTSKCILNKLQSIFT